MEARMSPHIYRLDVFEVTSPEAASELGTEFGALVLIVDDAYADPNKGDARVVLTCWNGKRLLKRYSTTLEALWDAGGLRRCQAVPMEGP